MASASLESHLGTAIGQANAKELIEALDAAHDSQSADIAGLAAKLEQATLDLADHAGRFSLLNDQLGQLTARVEALEKKCAPQAVQGVSK